MNNRERLLAILDGQPPDHIPWIPRILLWYNARRLAGALPPKWENLSLREIEHDLRIGTPARDGRVFSVEYDGVELEIAKAQDTLVNLNAVWGRPVHIETVIDGRGKVFSFDGQEHKEVERRLDSAESAATEAEED